MRMHTTYPAATGRCWLPTFLVVSAAILLGGCSWFSTGDSEAPVGSLPPLEVPPDLVSPRGEAPLVIPALKPAAETPAQTTTEASPPMPRIAESVLPAQKDVRLLRDGSRRWLQVAAEPEQVWPLVRGFLTDNDYRIGYDEPAIGLLETDWHPLAMTDEEAGNWRERLRLRIEPGEQAGSTEIYLSQLLQERNDEGHWALRSPDEDRAALLLNRLARHLGQVDVSKAIPLTPLAASMGEDDAGNLVLRVEAPWEQVWRRTGMALDRLGFVIEDHDRANRLYSIYTEVASGKTEEEVSYGKPASTRLRLRYGLAVRETVGATLLQVQDDSGRVDNSAQARHLLTQLQAQLQ